MKTYQGKCHCGAVRFEVDTDLASSFRCNCTFCVRRGATMQKVPEAQFHLLSGESDLSKYGGRDFSKHFFCSKCGINCFTRLDWNNQKSVAVNVGCLEGANLDALQPSLFDGLNKL